MITTRNGMQAPRGAGLAVSGAAAAVILLGFAMRLHRLDAYSLWLDELGQASVAVFGLREAILGAQAHHGAAPLDYVLSWLSLLVLGRHDFAIRLPAVFLGTLTLALTYRLGRSLFDAPVGVLAALLLAVAPLHLRYSQEARFYALFTALGVASTVALIAALGRGGWQRWLVYAALLAAMLYSHYYAVLLAAVQGVAVLANRLWPVLFPLPGALPAAGPTDSPSLAQRLRGVVPFAAACLVAGIAFLPWYFDAVVQETGIAWARVPELTPRQLGELYAGLVYGPDLVARPGGLVAVWMGLVLLGTLAGLAGQRTRLGALLLACAVFVLPPVIILILRRTNYFFAERQVLFLLPFCVLLAVFGAAWLVRLVGWLPATSRAQRILWAGAAAGIATALVAVTAWQGQPAVYASYHTPRNNFRDGLAFIDANAGPDDLLVAPRQLPSYFHYYVPSWTGRLQTPASADELQALAEQGKPIWLLTSGTPALTEEMRRWLEGTERIRLDFPADVSVYYIEPGHSVAEMAPAMLTWQPPHGAQALIGLARYYQQAGAVDQADRAARDAQAAAENPQQASAYAEFRGSLWQKQGATQRAIQGYRDALALWPDNQGALIDLAKLLAQQEQLDEAVQLLQRAAALAPSSARPHWLLGNTLWQQGRLDEAAGSFRTAIALDPTNADLYLRLGKLLARMGDSQGAAAAFAGYLALAPEGAGASEARARLQALQGN